MAQLLPNGRQQFLDANGNPLAGGLVYFYIPNTTTPKDTWQNAGQTILNTNPVVLDARGQATIYGSGAYRQILEDAAGNVIWDKDSVASSVDYTGPDDPGAAAGAYASWPDTANNLLKRRNADNTAWVVEGGLLGNPTNQNFLSLNGGQLAGMRNKIINGAFQINQRGYVSGAATTAGQYTLDRWKVTGTDGITFSTVSGKTTVTIPGGQTLQQVIEDVNLPPGDYVLSWEGTAQGRIDGGSYGASGSVTVTLAGGANSTVEFNAGTLANVQLEPGTIATVFEARFGQVELALCDYYYRPFTYVGGVYTGVNSYTFTITGAMRAVPSVTNAAAGAGSAYVSIFNGSSSFQTGLAANVLSASLKDPIVLTGPYSGAVSGWYGSIYVGGTLSAEL